MKPTIAILKTSPENILNDYSRLMHLAEYEGFIDKEKEKGVVRTLLKDGFKPERLLPIENKTVVTDPHQGAIQNLWQPVLERYGLGFLSLTDVDWQTYSFKSPLLRLNQIFPEGIEIPSMFPGKQIIHLPTVKTHGHSITTGAIKNSFGGLLKEVRHYAHKYIHEVLVDLMIIQKELHPGLFAVMDGTVCGNGAGPRTMIPTIKNYLLAGRDQVALDAIAARMMGFDPLSIPYLRMCQERELGIADPSRIRVIGDDISGVNFGFKTRRSLVIWGDSNIYHDVFWYPLIGLPRIRKFRKTEWGKLWQEYYEQGSLSGQTEKSELALTGEGREKKGGVFKKSQVK